MGMRESIAVLRTCIAPDPGSVAGMESLLDLCKSLFQALTHRQDIQLVGCHSYELIPHVRELIEATGTQEYVLLDTHLLEYFCDFAQLTPDTPDRFEAFFFKYMREVEACGSQYAYSAFYSDMLSHATPFRTLREDRTLWDRSLATILLAFLHELCHSYPDIMAPRAFREMLQATGNTLRERVDPSYGSIPDDLMEECYCDFSALMIATATDLFTRHFQLSKQQLCALFFQMLTATSLIDIHSNATVQNINAGGASISRLELNRLTYLFAMIEAIGTQSDFFEDINLQGAYRNSLQLLHNYGQHMVDSLLYTVQRELDRFLHQKDAGQRFAAEAAEQTEKQKTPWVYLP